jgi:hypothetical protein
MRDRLAGVDLLVRFDRDARSADAFASDGSQLPAVIAY